ncbi:MAG: ABC transporter permease [Bacteroidota bacterium]
MKATGKTCLEKLFTPCVVATSGEKYFGDEDPIGKIMNMDGDTPFEVTAVFEDVPENSHIRFDFLLSYATINKWTKDAAETTWGWYDFYSFVRLRPGT